MTTRRKSTLVSSRRSPGARNALAFFTLFAFLFQGLITQSHIHGATFSSGPGFGAWMERVASAGESVELGKLPSKKAPADDSSRCPFCQATQLAGAFVSAAAIVILLPDQNISLIPPSIGKSREFSTASHAWRGRAPPTD